MDRDRGRGRRPAEDPELDKAEVAGPGGRHDAPFQSGEYDDETTKVEGIRYTEQRIRLSLTPRRVRIDAREKRVSYIQRLEDLMQECDTIISDPEGFEEIQVKAMAILASGLLAGERGRPQAGRRILFETRRAQPRLDSNLKGSHSPEVQDYRPGPPLG